MVPRGRLRGSVHYKGCTNQLNIGNPMTEVRFIVNVTDMTSANLSFFFFSFSVAVDVFCTSNFLRNTSSLNEFSPLLFLSRVEADLHY